MKIRILTCTTKNRKNLYDITNISKNRYVAMHDEIEYVFSDTFQENIEWGLYWLKPQFIKQNISNSDFVLWMDDDAGIVNNDFDLVSYVSSLDPNRSIFIAEDENGINAGVILMRNSEKSIECLDYLIQKDIDYKKKHWDQDAFVEFFNSNPNDCQLIPGNIFNAHSYAYTRNNKNMENENTFIVHVGGGDLRKKTIFSTSGKMESIFHIRKKIQYGIGKQWNGIGDLLCLLPAINKKPNDYQLVIASHMKRMLPLFIGYDVIVDDSILPVSTHLNMRHPKMNEHIAKQTLEFFNISDSDFIPKIKIDLLEKHTDMSFLKKRNELDFDDETVLATNVKKTSEDERGVSKEFFEKYVRSNPRTLFHHFRMDDHYSFNEKNVVEYTNIDLARYAVACSKIKKYFGVNTGDYHLAIASGVLPKDSTAIIPLRCPQIIIFQWIYPNTKIIRHD